MRLVFRIEMMIVLGLLTLRGSPAPPYPFPWFTEHFRLGPMPLPVGVGVEVVLPSGGTSAESIAVSNTTSTELYVVGTYYLSNPVYPKIPIELAPGIGPLNKIVAGRAYKWDWDYDGSTNRSSFSWKPEDNNDQGNTVWLYSTLGNRLSSDVGMVLQLEQLNQYGGHRPADVKIPTAQTVLLPIVYGAQLINIPLTISYSLNQNYQPEPDASLIDYESPDVQLGLILGCLIVGALVVVIVWQSVRVLLRAAHQRAHER